MRGVWAIGYRAGLVEFQIQLERPTVAYNNIHSKKWKSEQFTQAAGDAVL